MEHTPRKPRLSNPEETCLLIPALLHLLLLDPLDVEVGAGWMLLPMDAGLSVIFQ
jgi:hypothetical protein